MPDKAGTLEKLLIALARALQPLADLLQPDQFQELFSELGLNFPDTLLGNPGFLAALDATAVAAGELENRVNALRSAIEADDSSSIISESVQTRTAISSLLSSLHAIASELQTLSDSIPGLSPADVNDFAKNLAARLFDFLVVRHLEGFFPLSLHILALLGAVEFEAANPGSTDPHKPATTRRLLRLKRLNRLLRDPSSVLESVYHWGEADLKGELLLWRLFDLFRALGVPAFFDSPEEGGPAIRLLKLRIGVTSDLPIPGLVLSNEFDHTGGISRRLRFLVPGWAVEVSLTGDIQAGLEALILPPQRVILLPPAGQTEGEAQIRVFAQPLPPATSILLLGEAGGGSRVEVGLATLGVGASFEWNSTENQAEGEFFAEVALFGGRVLIDTSKGDSFLRQLTSNVRVEADFDLRAIWKLSSGLRFEGSSGLEIQLPVHVSLGPLDLTGLYVVSDLTEESNISLEISGALRAQLGPLQVVIDRLGFEALLAFPDEGGNLGLAQFGVGFKPPAGMGLSIDGGGFKGGGFLRFEPEEQRYVGVLELEFQEGLALKAIGLLTTRLPGGAPGFSLLIIISASDFIPIQLGLGFTLNGVGGLLGLNRTARVERLRTGLRDNTLHSILFPQNIIANADRILSDLRQVFPPQDGRFLFGPLARIGWGSPTLITADVGLLIEVPQPVRVFILGVARALLPDEETKLLQLQVNFLGDIDFEREQFAFDASLFDSKLLSYPLSGDLAARVKWGDRDPNFLVTVGGFHPAYDPPPLGLPVLRRLTVQLLSGDNPRLTLEIYVALTSNTAQFGARLELYAAAGKFNVYGFLSFDTLFQFNPFYFIAEVAAMLALRVGSKNIASIQLSLTLEGTTPWKARGTATLKLCWFIKIKVRFNKTFGEVRDTRLDDVAVLPLLRAALSDRSNWEAGIPTGRHLLVSVKEFDGTGDQIIAHPFGVLTISQKVVPLNIEIQRFGNQRPADGHRFAIEQVRVGEGEDTETLGTSDVQEQFAPAQFFELTDTEKLSSRSFERYDAGVRVTDSERLDAAYAAKRDVDYELFYIDSQRDQRLRPWFELLRPEIAAFNAWASQGAVAASPLSFANHAKSALAPDAVQVSLEPFAVVKVHDLTLVQEDAVAPTEAGAFGLMSELIRGNPALEGEIQVVPTFEVNRS